MAFTIRGNQTVPRGLGLTPEEMAARRRKQNRESHKRQRALKADKNRALRAAMPKQRNRSNIKEQNRKAYEDWKRDGYVPSAYAPPPPAEHIKFDRLWWTSLSPREQVKILSAASPDLATQYASESKQRFIASNSAG